MVPYSGDPENHPGIQFNAETAQQVSLFPAPENGEWHDGVD
jgi:hypothetical protein